MDIRQNYSELAEMCRNTSEPIFLGQNGDDDLVVMSRKSYERQQAIIDLYGKLAAAEAEIVAGADGIDFLLFAKEMRGRVHGNI